MKMKFAFLILIAISSFCFSQDKKVVVSATKLNVLYRGIENPVELGAEGISSDKLIVTITNGTITKKTGTDYVIVPGAGDSVVVILSENKKVIGEKVFRVKNVPEPVIGLCDKTNGSIVSRTFLSTCNDIYAKKPPGFELESNYTILSFSVSVIDSPGVVKIEKTKGNHISASQASLIAKQESGEQIVFTDILVEYSDGRRAIAQPLILTLD
ncbi:MAG: hypothetical protein A2W91_14660 [Bacteroidetes bacterium GWF2_38_335]|nr:MAG: hypothetical protein A2W91_14660 [Bacteroidetes bacterium GWF2_38_335]OFY78444.1 MAG: hypothetical protein A2281_15970 [Bacteroidetes bacterium RIFOXYA12_FULL_38_20]HBS88389.1 hypothetical protein [Bacteroidales bacterium]